MAEGGVPRGWRRGKKGEKGAQRVNGNPPGYYVGSRLSDG